MDSGERKSIKKPYFSRISDAFNCLAIQRIAVNYVKIS